jgi:hypothetical protein
MADSQMKRGRVRFLSCTADHGVRCDDTCDINYILESNYNFYYGMYRIQEPVAKNLSLEDLRKTVTPRCKDQFRLLRKHGIRTVAYMSCTTMRTDSLDSAFVQRVAYRAPEGGTAGTFSRKNEIAACYSHPEWGEFLSDYAKVLCDEGLLDGVFLDNLWILRPCHCDACREKFAAEVAQGVLKRPDLTLKEVLEMQRKAGEEAMLPDEAFHKAVQAKQIDLSGEKFRVYNEYVRWRVRSAIEFLRAVRHKAERKLGRKMLCLINSHASFGCYLSLHAEEDIAEAPYFEEGFAFPPHNNIYAIKVGRSARRGDTCPVIITRVGPYGNPTPSQNGVLLGEFMAFGGAGSPWGFNIHGDRTLEEVNRRFNTFQRLYEEMFASERETAEVAILYSTQSHLHFEQNSGRPTAKAVAQLLLDLQIPFDLLMLEKEIRLAALRNYKMVILPELGCLPDKALKLLQDYAAAGGGVVSVGAMGRYDPDFRRRSPEPTLPNCVSFEPKDIQNRFSKSGEMASLPEGSAMMYMFNPPEGKLADFLRRQLLQHPLVRTSLPTGVYLNLTEGMGFLNLHLVNYRMYRFGTVVRIQIEPFADAQIEVRASQKIQNVRVISPDLNPLEQTIPFERKGDCVSLRLPLLKHYSIVHLEYSS